MWSFADPYLLWILAVLPAAAWLLYRRRRRPATVYPPTGHLPALPRSRRQIAAGTARPAFIAAMAMLIVAMARPQKRHVIHTEDTEAIAIQMVVDVSGSMTGLDFATPEEIRNREYVTRLDTVKKMFAEFVRLRPNDAIGLIAFGGYAVSHVPLTFDHDLLLAVLKDLEIPGSQYDREGLLIRPEEQMTAIGDALTLACARLENTDIQSRIVTLLSDGENNFGIITPEEATAVAAAMNIRVYTIAVGKDGVVPFLDHDQFGQPIVRHAFIGLDTGLLQSIATSTGGDYFHVQDASGFEKAMAAIDQLEKTPVIRDSVTHDSEKYVWPLTLGLLALLGAAIISCAVQGDPI